MTKRAARTPCGVFVWPPHRYLLLCLLLLLHSFVSSSSGSRLRVPHTHSRSDAGLPRGQHPYEPLGQRCLLPPHPLFSFSLHPLLSSSQSAQQPWGLTPHHQVNNLVTFDSSDLFDLISSHSHLTGGTSSVLRSPCPSSINSSPSTSAGIMRTPLSMLASPSIDCADYGAEGSCKPIDPEVCLELLWTEPGPVPRSVTSAF